MLSVLRFSVAHPRLTTALAGAAVVGSCLSLGGIELQLDARSLIPREHPRLEESDAAAERFDLRDVLVIAVASEREGVFTPAALDRLAVLSAEVAALDGVVPTSVASLATLPRLVIEDGVLDLRPLLARGEVASPDLARKLRAEVRELGLDDGVLAARDGRAAAIYAEVEDGADRSRLHREVQRLASRRGGEGVEVHFSGTALAQAVLGEAAALDLVRLVPAVLAVVGLVLLIAFRHPAPVVVSFAEIGVSLLATAGVMGALGEHVFVTTLSLPVILVVIGVSDDIYALNRYFDLARRRRGEPVDRVVLEAFAEVRKPVLLTSVTTVVGLLSLLATELEPQRVFGLYGSLAVALSTLLTFTLVPAMLVLLDPKVSPLGPAAQRHGERLVDALLRTLRRAGPRRVLAGVAAVAALCLALASRLEIGDSWITNLPPASETARGDRAINRLLAGTNTLELMFDSGEPDGFLQPEALRALGTVERALAASPEVGSVQGPFTDLVRVLASLEGAPFAEYRRRVWERPELLSPDRIAQAFLLLESLERSPLVDRLDDLRRRARLTVFVESADYQRMGRVLAAASGPGIGGHAAGPPVPFGDGWVGYTTIQLLVLGQVWSVGLAVLLDTLLLILLFRSVRTAVLAVAPVALGILAVFAVLGATGSILGTASSMFAAIALGIGVDYSIHLVATQRQRLLEGPPAEAVAMALRSTGPAILTSAVAIGAGFLVLLASQVPPNRQLGWLVALSMTVCAMVTLILVPSMSLAREGRR